MAETVVSICTPALARLLAAAEPVGRDYAVTAYANQCAGRVRLLVATTDGRPVGSCEVTQEDRPRVVNLNVVPGFRGRGVGSLLIAHAESAAAGRGQLAIWVDEDNPRARQLYHRLGYRPTGGPSTTTYAYVDDEGAKRVATETDAEMVKRLGVAPGSG